MAHELQDEVTELQQLLALAKAPGNVRDLAQILARKKQALEAAQSPPVVEPQEAPKEVKPTPTVAAVARTSDVDDVNAYTEITRFGWEDEGACSTLRQDGDDRYDGVLTCGGRLREGQGGGVCHVGCGRRRRPAEGERHV